ncbi:MAG: cation:proton antiporter [Acidobacteriota bacterium]
MTERSIAEEVLRPRSSLPRTAFAYLAMFGAAVGLFLWLAEQGGSLVAPAPAAGVPQFGGGGPAGINTLLHVLLALAVVLITARAVGALFRRLGQPPVIGEVIAGILLGPSLLGWLAPSAYEFLLPMSIAPHLGVLAQIGVILFMFLVGMELDTGTLRHGTHSTIAISHASIVVPFLLGSTFALWLYPRYSTSDVPFVVFALFLGVSLSVTAFPVLARILNDQNLHRTPLGTLALTCAAVDDVTAWCLLAFVVSVAKAQLGRAAVTVVLTLVFIAVVLLFARPLLLRLVERVEREGRLTQTPTALLFIALLLSSLATESIGIHALFGAFLLGAVIPHDSRVAKDLAKRIEDLVIIFLLPAFFAFTGMRTQIGLVRGASEWAVCGAIVLIATLGKFGGSYVAARLTHIPWRESAALGVLMNTRGLMQLIVLNIGLDLKVLSPQLFAMFVLMAIITTLMTAPILERLIGSKAKARRDPALP